jgi:hypothetical protein
MKKRDFDICEHPPRCFPETDCSQEQAAWTDKCVEVTEGVYVPRHEPVDTYATPIIALLPYILLFAVAGTISIVIGLCNVKREK